MDQHEDVALTPSLRVTAMTRFAQTLLFLLPLVVAVLSVIALSQLPLPLWQAQPM